MIYIIILFILIVHQCHCYQFISKSCLCDNDQFREHIAFLSALIVCVFRKGLGTEMKTWEASKMWPFSVVGFEKDSPCIPGKIYIFNP